MVKWRGACAAFLLLLLLLHPPLLFALRIDHLWVPDAMKNGSSKSAILDCDYSLDERDKETLEVKWYFRHDPTPIYQWVPPDTPQVSDNFAEFVNLDYTATNNPYTRHRALQLRPLSTRLSGRYACRVSSIYKDDFRTKDMIIYATPRILDATAVWIHKDTLNASCIASDAYPEPKVRIFVSSDTTDSMGKVSYDITDKASVDRTVEWSSAGLYMVRSSALLKFPLCLSVLKPSSKQQQQQVEPRNRNGTVVD